jgi:hypothetical protein
MMDIINNGIVSFLRRQESPTKANEFNKGIPACAGMTTLAVHFSEINIILDYE